MIRVSSIALTFCLAALPVHALDILGTWRCLDQDPEGTSVSLVTFKKNGTMTADMQFVFNVPGFDVRARAKYKSRYTLSDDGIFEDRPVSARVLSFTADGDDMSKSDEAKMLKDYLMTDDDVKAQIKTATATDLVIHAEDRDITCQRVVKK